MYAVVSAVYAVVSADRVTSDLYRNYEFECFHINCFIYVAVSVILLFGSFVIACQLLDK